MPPMEQVLNPFRNLLVDPRASVPLLHPLSYLARLLTLVTGRVHNCIRMLMTFLSSKPDTTFGNCESWPARRELPVSMSCDQRVCYFQPQDITVKFWRATKSNANSLYWVFRGWFSKTPLTKLQISKILYAINHKPRNPCLHTQTKDIRITGDDE